MLRRHWSALLRFHGGGGAAGALAFTTAGGAAGPGTGAGWLLTGGGAAVFARRGCSRGLLPFGEATMSCRDAARMTPAREKGLQSTFILVRGARGSEGSIAQLPFRDFEAFEQSVESLHIIRAHGALPTPERQQHFSCFG